MEQRLILFAFGMGMVDFSGELSALLPKMHSYAQYQAQEKDFGYAYISLFLKETHLNTLKDKFYSL